MHEQDELVIVPIVVEPCDWLSTPLKRFKALPKDGKSISTWENRNTAFLDVIQNLRKLAESTSALDVTPRGATSGAVATYRNYKVKKDFDSIEKIEFVEKTFHEVVSYLKRFLEEVIQLDNIKARTVADDAMSFEGLLVNRNKIATEATLKFARGEESRNQGYNPFGGGESKLSYSITTKDSNRPSNVSFELEFDEYHLFWTQRDSYSNSREKKEFDAKEIADIIWNQWLELVGMYIS